MTRTWTCPRSPRLLRSGQPVRSLTDPLSLPVPPSMTSIRTAPTNPKPIPWLSTAATPMLMMTSKRRRYTRRPREVRPRAQPNRHAGAAESPVLREPQSSPSRPSPLLQFAKMVTSIITSDRLFAKVVPGATGKSALVDFCLGSSPPQARPRCSPRSCPALYGGLPISEPMVLPDGRTRAVQAVGVGSVRTWLPALSVM